MPDSTISGTGFSDITFTTLRGTFSFQNDVVQVMERPGIDGARGRLLGKKAPKSRFIGVKDTTTAANANAQRKLMRAIQGKIVQVVDDLGITTTDVLVKEAREATEIRKQVSAVGGIETTSDRFIVSFEFEMIPLDLVP